jgi:hypothetical protein
LIGHIAIAAIRRQGQTTVCPRQRTAHRPTCARAPFRTRANRRHRQRIPVHIRIVREHPGPRILAQGRPLVHRARIVNGEIALENGEPTGVKAGKMLLKQHR